jgi:hypothetical protein
MINITKTAIQAFTRYFEDRDISPIRIFYNSGG